MRNYFKLNSVRAAVVGFATGLVLSVGYIMSGGSSVWPPRWASILFSPGFAAGFFVYNHVSDDNIIPATIGCLTVAITYAIIFGLLFAVFQRWSRRNDS